MTKPRYKVLGYVEKEVNSKKTLCCVILDKDTEKLHFHDRDGEIVTIDDKGVLSVRYYGDGVGKHGLNIAAMCPDVLVKSTDYLSGSKEKVDNREWSPQSVKEHMKILSLAGIRYPNLRVNGGKDSGDVNVSAKWWGPNDKKPFNEKHDIIQATFMTLGSQASNKAKGGKYLKDTELLINFAKTGLKNVKKNGLVAIVTRNDTQAYQTVVNQLKYRVANELHGLELLHSEQIEDYYDQADLFTNYDKSYSHDNKLTYKHSLTTGEESVEKELEGIPKKYSARALGKGTELLLVFRRSDGDKGKAKARFEDWYKNRLGLQIN